MAEQASAVKRHFTQLLELKRKSADAKEIKQNAEAGLLLLLKLKDAFRKTAENTEVLRSKAGVAKSSLGESQLRLENILYETTYYEKEIEDCRRFQSAYSDDHIGLMPVEEFKASLPDGVNEDVLCSDEHLLMLKRLSHELEERQRMRRVLEQKEVRKKALAEVVQAKFKQLNGIKTQLGNVAKATDPLKESLEVRNVGLPKLLPAVELLPLPLFVLYSQLVAAQEAYDLKLNVKIVGSMESALKQLSDQSTTVDEEASGLGTETKRRKTEASETLDGNALYKEHPLSLAVALQGNSKPVLTVQFFYLPNLKIVTAGCEVATDNQVLASLYPADDGASTPNLANKLLLDGTFEFDPARTDRPYRWAQLICGLDFLPDHPLSAASSDMQEFEEGMRTLRSEKRILHVVQQLRQHKLALDALKAQLDKLTNGQLPHPKLYKAQCTMSKWEAVHPPQAPAPRASKEPHTTAPVPTSSPPASTAGDTDMVVEQTGDGDEELLLYGDINDNPVESSDATSLTAALSAPPSPALYQPRHRVFKIYVRRDQAEVEVQVTVYLEYPTFVPQFKLMAVWDTSKVQKSGRASSAKLSDPMVANDIVAVEHEVNVRVLELCANVDPSRLLSYQVVHLLRCVDAYSHSWPLVRSKDPAPTLSRGRDMRIVFRNDAF